MNWIKKWPILFLLLVGILTRVIVFILYEGQISFFNDSGGYTKLAQHLFHFDLSTYNFGRTPGYPLFILLAFQNIKGVVLLQNLMGLLNSILLFDIGKRMGMGFKKSLMLGVLPSVLLHFLLYERSILTEYATLSCLLFCFWYLVKIEFFKKNTLTWKEVIVMGLLSALVLLIRPMFIILPVWIFAFFIIKNRKYLSIKRFFQLVVLLIPGLLFILGWSHLNEKHTGYQSLTSFSGINISQNTVSFIHKADDQYAPLRDLYVRKRDSLIAAEKDPAMAVWRTFNELNQKDTLSIAQFSEQLDPMNTSLIKENPSDYAKQVAVSWFHFWKTKMMWTPEMLQSETKQIIISSSWNSLFKYVILLIKFCFLLVVILSILGWFLNICFKDSLLWFIIVFVMGASLGQALVTFGSNARFAMPFLLLMVVAIFQFYSIFKSYVRSHTFFKRSLDIPTE